MRGERFSISRADRSDLEDILLLLAIVTLPHDGVAEHLDDFLVARDDAGRLVGCIGLERHGRLALLRSAAVRPELQRAGLGSRLTAALLELAAKEGVTEVALLTTTARDFFAQRFGFTEARRADYDGRLAQSPEWQLPRCSSAVFMKLDIQGDNQHRQGEEGY